MSSNPARLLGRFPDGSPEWHEARRTRLGGSEIAAVIGLSPWESPFSLWHRKAGNVPAAADNPAMEWGRLLEPVVRDKFMREHGITRMIRGTYVHRTLPWMLANPDGLYRDGHRRALVEIKTTARADGWGPAGTDEIPVHYACQVRWYLGVLGIDRATLAVLIGGSDYREYVIEQDVDDLRYMVDAGREFMASLESGQQPDLDGSYATYAAVRQMHPDIDGTDIEVDPDIAAEWLVSKAAHDAAQADYRRASAELMTAMGTARNAIVTDPDSLEVTRIAWRQSSRGSDPYLMANRKALARFTAPKEQTA